MASRPIPHTATVAAASGSSSGYSTGLDRRFYGETVTLISTREIQDSERKSTQSKHSVRNDDTNRSRTAAMGGDTIQTRRDKCTEARRRLCKRRRSSGFGWLRRTCYLPLISPPGIPAYEFCSSGQVTMCPRALASRCRCPTSQQQHAGWERHDQCRSSWRRILSHPSETLICGHPRYSSVTHVGRSK